MKLPLIIKSFFDKLDFKKAGQESSGPVFEDYLRIKAEIQASDVNINDDGINFKVNYRGSVVPFWLACNGEISAEKADPKVQDALAAIAVGLATGLNLVEISQILEGRH